MLFPLRVFARTSTGVQPLPQEDANCRNTHITNAAYNTKPLGDSSNHSVSLAGHQHLAVFLRVAATQLVDPVEVVGRDDETVKLPQVTAVRIGQAVHAVVVHCGLTPHTPKGGSHRHNTIRNGKITQKGGSSLNLRKSQWGGLPPALTGESVCIIRAI